MATSKRQKKEVKKTLSAEELESAFAEYSKADARIREINAKIDQKVAKIREEHAVELAGLADTKEYHFDSIQTYAENNDHLFADKKSIDLAHGTIGFRMGTHKVKLKKGFQWNGVIRLMKSKLKDYLRVATEPAKDKLIADRNEKGMAKKLEACGIEIVQDETFYIDLKKEEVPA